MAVAKEKPTQDRLRKVAKQIAKRRRNRPGRPKLPRDEKRSACVFVSLDASERKELDIRARAKRTSRSNMMRQAWQEFIRRN